MKYSIYFLSLLVLVLSSGCYEDYNNTVGEPEVFTESPEIYIDTEITGKVSSADGTVLDDYSLVINGISYPQTNPYFIQSIKEVKKKGQVISVVKDNKVIALANIPLIENDINPIQLSPFTNIKTTESIDAYEVIHDDLAIKGIIGGNSDNITVYSALINPTIGVQSGFDASKQHLILSPKMGVFLSYYSSSGDELDLSSTIQLNLSPANLQGMALFQLSEEGKWELKIDNINRTVIDIDGAGTYLFASYQLGVLLEGIVQKENEPIAYQHFTLTSDDFSSGLNSTVNGAFISVVPADDEIELLTQSPCQKEVSSDLVSTQKVNVKDIIINITTPNDHHKLVTEILDCEGNISDLPAVKIINNQNGEEFYLFGASQINNWIPICEGDFSIAAYNIEDQSTGPIIPWSSAIADNVDYLSDCIDWANGYSYIEINGEGKIFDPFNVIVQGGETRLVSTDNKIRLRIKGDMEGSFNVEDINVYINDETLGSGYFISCENSPLGCGLDDFKMTHLQTEGGWVRASFSGTMWMQKLNPIRAGNYPISGQILIKVD